MPDWLKKLFKTIIGGLAKPKNESGPWKHVQVLSGGPGTASSGDYFGESVGFDGDIVAVGALFDEAAPNKNVGSVVVFEATGTDWGRVAQLLPSDGRHLDQFGQSLVVHDGNVLVGAIGANHPTGADNQAGRVYLFERNSQGTYSESAQFEGGNNDNDLFGSSVAMSKNRVVVAAPWEPGGGTVRIFDRSSTGWTLTQTLVGNTFGKPGFENLGVTTSLRGDTLILGGTGIVVLQRSQQSWSPEAVLEVPAHNALAFDGVHIAVGNTAGKTGGSVQVFERNSALQWVKKADLSPLQGKNYPDMFGKSVALENDRLFVGAPWSHKTTESGSPSDPVHAGAVYVYRKLGLVWELEQRIVPDPSAASPFDGFGHAVAAQNPYLIVGARQGERPKGPVDSGVAHIYRLANLGGPHG